MATQTSRRLFYTPRRKCLSHKSTIKLTLLTAPFIGSGILWNISLEIHEPYFSTISNSNSSLYADLPKYFDDQDEAPSSDGNQRRNIGTQSSRSTSLLRRGEFEAISQANLSASTSRGILKDNSASMSVGVGVNNPQLVRLYCMVPFLWTPAALPTYHAIRSTWGKRCHVLKFFIDPIIGDIAVGYYNMTEESGVKAAQEANLTIPHDDVVILHDMRRPWHICSPEENKNNNKPIGTCRNIWEKIWRAWMYVALGAEKNHPVVGVSEKKRAQQNDVYSAEWFVKVDADTFLFPDNLRRYVEEKGWSHHDHHYFGHVLNHRKVDRNVSIVAGAAVFFSRATILALADTFSKMPMEGGDQEEDGTCRDAYTGTEEVVTAVCLKEYINVTADSALDSRGREKVSLYDVEPILTYNRTSQGEWWFWAGKKRFPCHDDGDCISHLPLAFHGYKNPQSFLDFENEFYGDDASDRVERQKYVIEYFDKVRSAMRSAADAETITFDNTNTRRENHLTSMNHLSEQPHQTLFSTNRLYCMVPFIWTPKYLPSYHAIRRTWGKRCDILKFMIDPIVGDNTTGFQDLRVNSTNFELPEDTVAIMDIKRPWNTCDTTENCRNIWEKIWRSIIWMDGNGDLDLADWFVKVDADTYLFPEHLKRYVIERQWLPSEQHYFGHILHHRFKDAASIIAGAAVFFSQATLKSAVEIFKRFNDTDLRKYAQDCKDDYTSEEEVVTAVCLKEHINVDAQPILDDIGRELITVARVEETLAWNRTEQGDWWYWQHKPKFHAETGIEMHQCCGDFPVAFHGYKDPQVFYKFENEFYGTEGFPDVDIGWKSYEWSNPLKTNAYFNRVRQAMKESSSMNLMPSFPRKFDKYLIDL